MHFRINLATRTYINRKKANSAIAAAIAVLLLFLFVQIIIYSRNAGELSRLESLKSADKARIKKTYPEFTEKDYAKLTDDIKFSNILIQKKTYDWIGLLNRLENVTPNGLTITSLVPDSKEQSLKLEGVSIDFGAMRKFIENLEASGDFSDVYLFKQVETVKEDKQKVISFSITCKYKL